MLSAIDVGVQADYTGICHCAPGSSSSYSRLAPFPPPTTFLLQTAPEVGARPRMRPTCASELEWTCRAWSKRGSSPNAARKTADCSWCGTAGWCSKSISAARAVKRIRTWLPRARHTRASPAESWSRSFTTKFRTVWTRKCLRKNICPKHFRRTARSMISVARTSRSVSFCA